MGYDLWFSFLDTAWRSCSLRPTKLAVLGEMPKAGIGLSPCRVLLQVGGPPNTLRLGLEPLADLAES